MITLETIPLTAKNIKPLERFRLKKIIFILVLLNSSFVFADQKDSRLNSLFDELFLSNDNMQASTILADIWDIWSIAENVEAQKYLTKATI